MITLVQAQEILAALMQAQLNGVTEFSSVSIAGRTVSYRTGDDLERQIITWSRVVNDLSRRASGGGRIGYSVARFNHRS